LLNASSRPLIAFCHCRVEDENHRIRRVKFEAITLAILASLSASLAQAEDFKTINGKEYKNATVSRVEADGIVIKFHGGIAKIFFVELPNEVQRRFGHDPDKIGAEKAAARAAEEKRINEQKAAERERAEREKGLEADMKQSAEKFKAAEQRAKQAYQNAAKGTLSGQVFVSTAGGDSVKLGGVQVQLFARDAIDTLLPEIKKYAGYKIEQQRPLAEAKAALDQADAAVHEAQARHRAADYAMSKVEAEGAGGSAEDTRRMLDVLGRASQEFGAARKAQDAARATLDAAEKQHPEGLNFYYSGAFYFAFFQSPICSAETDADGKFVIEVPQTGRFVIAALAGRSIMDSAELYFWLQPISLEGQRQRVQNLSNNNLTSTTGTSALILTKEPFFTAQPGPPPPVQFNFGTPAPATSP
jgi:hypothetical protein